MGRRLRWLGVGGAGLLALLITGCGSAPTPTATAAPTEPERVEPPPLVEGELGGLNQEAMELAFNSLEPEIRKCVEKNDDALRQIIGGQMKINLRIGPRGETKWAYVSQSTLGDRVTENCVVALARARTWPKPLGGDGLAEKSFEVLSSQEPIEVKAKDIEPAIRKMQRKTARCRQGVSGTFSATAYLHPSGKVMAAGVTAPNEEADPACDCIADVLRQLHFGKLGRKPAKITFDLQ